MIENNYQAIVLGAGVIGCSVAWSLAKRGIHVLIIERNTGTMGGSSQAAFGSLTPFTDPFFEGEARDHAIRAVNLYRDSWLEAIQLESGVPVTFMDEGLIKICFDKDAMALSIEHVRRLNDSKYRARTLTNQEICELEPSLTGAFVGGVLYEDEPWMDVGTYLLALETALRQSPYVEFKFNTEVSQVSSRKRDVRIVTDNESYSCQHLIICTGLYPVNIEGYPTFQIKWIRGDAVALYTRDDKPLLKRHIYTKGGFITPRANGRMLLGYTYDAENDIAPLHAIRRDRIRLSDFEALIYANKRMLPALQDCEVGEVWRGWRPTPIDEMPILGPLSLYPKIVMALGHIGLGVTMAPATAECVADYCTGYGNNFPAIFNPERLIKTR